MSEVDPARVAEHLQQQDEANLRADGGDAENLPTLHVGDHVQDRDADDATMVVVGVTGTAAHEYRLGGSSKTVADANEGYPADDHVIEVVYPGREYTNLSGLKEYAFPRSRLELGTPVHDRGDDQEEGLST
jgi:hypothetical protein